ncbi:MAG: UDP-N-acetylglucosamine--N-acetylmuramyl-(pentapeptide) pyrophosphoryl-undecaprenol N-acetylglucosamine transferase [Planctomycetes bacterium]|nr:UDP-N-acetylglucosamine--N-acetylmuramyl-(pentapeptide) pyrophosphoryl-undecaprenol N-acetylglucosamine transferase [Planctomycetota bacterium]
MTDTAVLAGTRKETGSPPAAALKALAFFGGGTGGHLFPGLAVAERARERCPDCDIVFFRTRRDVEEKVFANSGFRTELLDLSPPSGGAGAMVKYSLQSLRAIPMIRKALTRSYDAAIGLGGYASLPGIVAARHVGLPVVLLEQNQVPGKVNRFAAPFVDLVTCPSPEVVDLFRGRREVTGNPVRGTVVRAAGRRRRWFAAGAFSTRKRKVFVVGGSQGAHGINKAIIGALEGLSEYREKIHWIHVAGDADKKEVEKAYRDQGWEAEVVDYLKDLPHLLSHSDLVITRAGGTIVAELAVLGVPAVFVPYPHHKDQHQLKNAEALERAGGAILVPEEELGADVLRTIVEEILFEPGRLLEMEDCALSLGRPDAADAVLDLILELKETCQ